MATMIVLTLNGGSSSLKFGLYWLDQGALVALVTGEAEGGHMTAREAKGTALQCPDIDQTPSSAIHAIAQLLTDGGFPQPHAIGHRVVHGGPNLGAHAHIDEALMQEMDRVRELSPLHALAAIAIIDMAQATWPELPQVACFDTVFHARMPNLARTLPLPHKFADEGIRKYGFHGLSCESIVGQLGGNLRKRTIVAHLGGGASVTAIQEGLSIDTSMGLTPTGGCMMSTRSGDIDPGVLLYLLRERKLTPTDLEELLDRGSGLLGVSAFSSDLRELHEAAQGNADVRLAIAMFCRSIAKQIAGMVVSLGGVDAIVFTGGIGEHDAEVRQEICEQLGCFGIRIDEAANDAGSERIHSAASSSELLILPSLENEQIARHTRDVLNDAAPPP